MFMVCVCDNVFLLNQHVFSRFNMTHFVAASHAPGLKHECFLRITDGKSSQQGKQSTLQRRRRCKASVLVQSLGSCAKPRFLFWNCLFKSVNIVSSVCWFISHLMFFGSFGPVHIIHLYSLGGL